MIDKPALHKDRYVLLIECLAELPGIAVKVEELTQLIRSLQAHPKDRNKIDDPPADEDLTRSQS